MRKSLLAVVVSLLAAGCATKKSTEMPTPPPNAKVATAKLEPKSGSQVTGDVQFVQGDDGKVTMTLHVKNLTQGPHALHLHEKGDCSAADGSSAGPHWNPTAQPHGKMEDHMPHHSGDIGNIDVAMDGTGTSTLTTDEWSIGTGQPNDIIGRGVIVHSNADDFTSQPAGNAGSRVACGVVTAGTGAAAQ
ncbi:MAG: superoxide dismutase family protein [Myxococcaceae bacterium]